LPASHGLRPGRPRFDQVALAIEFQHRGRDMQHMDTFSSKQGHPFAFEDGRCRTQNVIVLVHSHPANLPHNPVGWAAVLARRRRPYIPEGLRIRYRTNTKRKQNKYQSKMKPLSSIIWFGHGKLSSVEYAPALDLRF